MEIFELKKDKIISDWITLIDARPTTINNYIIGMRHYTEFREKNS